MHAWEDLPRICWKGLARERIRVWGARLCAWIVVLYAGGRMSNGRL
jgi:hypothetical protein